MRSASANRAKCYALADRDGGCPCGYDDGLRVVEQVSLCASDCCSGGTCNGDKAPCYRTLIIVLSVVAATGLFAGAVVRP